MSKIPDNEPDFSEKVTERFLSIIAENKLLIRDELTIFQTIADKYKVITIADYATHVGKAYNTVQAMIKSGKVASIDFSGKTFILESLC